MDYKEYEKYMNDRKAVTVENNLRIEKKFAECEKLPLIHISEPTRRH